MPRVLIAARARVAEANQMEYRRAAAELARRYAARGQHVWVYRSADDPELLVEFLEAKDRAALAPADPAEAALCARLDALATERDPGPVWVEVPLP